MRILIGVLVAAALAVAAGLWISRPQRLPDAALAGLSGDAEAGARIFWAAGCAGCHAAPEAEGAARLILAGGRRFDSDFGTFVAPNVSMHPEAGIGAWSFADFANAVQRGVAPDGRHYYPAFPYGAYALARPQDIADLWAYWQTLPESDAASLPHEIGFPVTLRRGIGLWKAAFLPQDFATPAPQDDAARQGRYLAEALSHCGECHTPRGTAGQPLRDAWLAGAQNPSGEGRIPNITPAALTWSEGEIAAYLNDGFTPDFDSAGGHMAEVIRSLAELPQADRDALAAYLVQVPPVE